MRRAGALFACAGPLLFVASASHAGQPHMAVDPDALEFEPKEVGLSTPSQSVTIANTDPQGSSLSVSSVALSAGQVSDFDWSCDGGGQACIPTQVEPGTSISLFVTFTPTAAGPRSATLTVTGNDGANPSEDVALSGVGFEHVFSDDFEPGSARPFSGCVGCTDTSPPGEVDLFEALTGGVPGSVDLAFTAPFEDGASGGAVWSYELRYSSSDIASETEWQNATVYPQTLVPSAPANTDGLTMVGLVAGEFYYLSIVAYDEVGNRSPLGSARLVQAGS